MSLRIRKLVEDNPGSDARDFLRKGPDYDGFRGSDDDNIVKRELRTMQSFKDLTDINKMLKHAQKEGSLAHIEKYPEAVYGEFDGYDLLEAYDKLERANEIFAALPSEIRNEFGNDAIKFAGFASHPDNINDLRELLPQIAEPGPFFPNPVRRDVTSATVTESSSTTEAAASASSEPAPGDTAPAEAASSVT